MMKGEGKLHTKAFGRFQDVNGNVDRVENSGRRLSFFFFFESSIIVFVQYTVCTYIPDNAWHSRPFPFRFSAHPLPLFGH
ncbi:hypothetical protein VN97_g1008 [Penicillium thymicola]|uniref:Uncharacterized protein n=1 Tax=Penicillium thymicola TaxID=293382 RepID=A0AAI9XCP8_PENTH|nr:hypothetical protein VN97_g1008 [Penicillium thymicola]